MTDTDDNWGLSVIVCCHNSAKRLPATLECLARTELAEPWEVIVVNNASSDETAAAALSFADKLPLRVVDEPEPGLSQARQRGLAEARYAILGFVDDDNQVSPDWAAILLANFKEHPEAAECGGPAVEICEVSPPDWFEQYKGNYAVDAPFDRAGYVQRPLQGAGLGVRKSAWESIREKGFVSLLSDRKGAALSSGGDFEMGFAFLLAGWKIYYDPRLLIHHYMPKERLHWEYLCRLNESFGRQSVVLDAYKAKLAGKPLPGWGSTLLRSAWAALRQLPAALRKREGDAAYLLWRSQWARTDEFWNRRGQGPVQPTI